MSYYKDLHNLAKSRAKKRKKPNVYDAVRALPKGSVVWKNGESMFERPIYVIVAKGAYYVISGTEVDDVFEGRGALKRAVRRARVLDRRVNHVTRNGMTATWARDPAKRRIVHGRASRMGIFKVTVASLGYGRPDKTFRDREKAITYATRMANVIWNKHRSKAQMTLVSGLREGEESRHLGLVGW